MRPRSPPARSAPAALSTAAPPVAALSYTSLQQHAQCGYRFYLERVLGLPADGRAAARASPARRRRRARPARPRSHRPLAARAARLRAPDPPDAAAVAAEAARAGARLADADAQEIAGLVGRLRREATLCARASRRSQDLRREQPFALRAGARGRATIPLVGVLDAVGREGERALVVDYKSDRVGATADPTRSSTHEYGDPARRVRARGAARRRRRGRGASTCSSNVPTSQPRATFRPQDVAALTAELAARADAILTRDFPVAPDPGPRICDGCPGRGSLCSWPLERTLGVPEGRLF